MLKTLTIPETLNQMLSAQSVIVDVRSEGEFAEAHVPGAVNVPLLNDTERVEVGTLYKKSGPEVARRRGLEIVSLKLLDLYHRIAVASGVANPPQVTSDTWIKVLDLVTYEIMQANFAAADFSQESLTGKAKEFDGEVSGVDGKASKVNGNVEPARAKELSARPRLANPLLPLVTGAKPITFYCWRGGARSKSMTLFAELLGFEAQMVSGGHKAFRNHALSFLESGNYPFKFYVLYGFTGSGKTRILREWLAEGKPVIDLEALAYHRGSAFGQVGIDVIGRQKDFENNLFWEMYKLAVRGEKFVVLEGESRRIGRCNLPEKFMAAMHAGILVKVDQTLEERVENILKDYVAPVDQERLLREARGALDVIKKRLGGEKHKELSELLEKKDFAKFTAVILADYYDKMYPLSRASSDTYKATIRSAGDWGKIIEFVC